MLTVTFTPLYFTFRQGYFDDFINQIHSDFEEEFQQLSVLSWVVGVALIPNISWPEIHKLNKLLPYFELIQHNRRIVLPSEGLQPIKIKMT